MSAIQVSRFVRLSLEERFQALFNDALAAACSEFGIGELAFEVNFLEEPGSPQNFFRGNRSLSELNLMQEPDLPAVAMWTGEGSQFGPGRREMPRTFSGVVFARWRFFLLVRGLRSSGLVDLREATEAAMMSCLAPEFSGMTYSGDLAWQPLIEQAWLDQDEQHVGFVQEVEFQASFEVNV